MDIEEIFGSTQLFDKESSEHKEATMLNNAQRVDLDRMDPLTLALSEATHLEKEVKDTYLEAAKLYLEDMQHNIFKNQFDLARIYPQISVDTWNNFLADKIVSVYINKHKRTLLKTAAEDNLSNPTGKNKRDNLNLIKQIEDQEATESTKNICIIRIPDIYDE